FPYVTPSGLVRACQGGAVADQVVDGGYSENTGIDTITSAVQQLMPALRARNAAALAGPGVVFLHNPVVASTPGKPAAPKATPEIVVPPLNLGDASQLGHTST